MNERMHLRAVGEVELQTERIKTCTISRLPTERCHSSHPRVDHKITGCHCDRNRLEMILQCDAIVCVKSATVTNPNLEKLAIIGLCVGQPPKHRGCRERATRPEA